MAFSLIKFGSGKKDSTVKNDFVMMPPDGLAIENSDVSTDETYSNGQRPDQDPHDTPTIEKDQE